jgi:hypothetical protein
MRLGELTLTPLKAELLHFGSVRVIFKLPKQKEMGLNPG